MRYVNANAEKGEERERVKHASQINVFVFLGLTICVQNDFKGTQCHNNSNNSFASEHSDVWPDAMREVEGIGD